MKTQRIRDPIHGLIVFDDDGLVDEQFWNLLRTADFQRLRRVKQLGVSEFVFPSASHTRLSHSIGVFHNARRLVKIINREIKLGRVNGSFDGKRARVALFAALLHDIEHGPFSHAFEEARKAIANENDTASVKGQIKKHEHFTAEMIKDSSCEIYQILQEAEVSPTEVAELVAAETPTDMYHAIVSSSFDADRLDYLVRDRYMTGTGTGAIDLDWLMDNVRVAEIDVSAPDGGGDSVYEHSFCLGYKARDAAEDFLLARYRLYTNVYFHKTTRGIEQLVSVFFRLLARDAASAGQVTGLADNHPLIRFFAVGGDTLANYRALDDTVVWGAIHTIASFGSGSAQNIAKRILCRERPVCLDIQQAFPEDSERQRRLKHALELKLGDRIGETVFKDSAKLSIYGEIGADDGRAQKRLMIQTSDKNLKEITDFKDATVAASDRQRSFDRYYFLSQDDFLIAEEAVQSIKGRHT